MAATNKKAVILCAGVDPGHGLPYPIKECLDCVRRTSPIKDRNEWISPPEFDTHCPEKINPEKKEV